MEKINRFKETLLKEEYDWLDGKVIKDSNTKKTYKKRVEKEVDKISKIKMKEVQKTLKELKLDKESWKRMLNIRKVNGDRN